MSFAKFLLRTVVVAVAMFALGFVGHQLLLGRAYSSIVPIMRGPADMPVVGSFSTKTDALPRISV